MGDRPRATSTSIRPLPSGAPAPEDQDSVLLRRMGDGDESALGALYDRWSNRVHTIAYRIVQDADEAEDVVEETFWQVWRTASQFDLGRASVSTWLLMIARSRSLDRLRARRRRDQRTAEVAASSLLDQLDGSTGAAASQPQSDEPSRALVEALAALPAEQREVLHLAFFDGLSHAEIAARTVQPLGTVKTRIRLAMDKLRSRLSSLRDR